jgi:hypothetical protein
LPAKRLAGVFFAVAFFMLSSCKTYPANRLACFPKNLESRSATSTTARSCDLFTLLKKDRFRRAEQPEKQRIAVGHVSNPSVSGWAKARSDCRTERAGIYSVPCRIDAQLDLPLVAKPPNGLPVIDAS